MHACRRNIHLRTFGLLNSGISRTQKVYSAIQQTAIYAVYAEQTRSYVNVRTPMKPKRSQCCRTYDAPHCVRVYVLSAADIHSHVCMRARAYSDDRAPARGESFPHARAVCANLTYNACVYTSDSRVAIRAAWPPQSGSHSGTGLHVWHTIVVFECGEAFSRSTTRMHSFTRRTRSHLSP